MEPIVESASLQRLRWLRFPTAVLVGGQPGGGQHHVVARLGRDGWFRVFLGRGRRVELSDGTRWRIGAGGLGGEIVPIVTCAAGTLAFASSIGERSYGINGQEFAYTLYPTSRKRHDGSAWLLAEYGTSFARFQSNSVRAERPVPLAAVLLGFTLIKYGVPGEGRLVPTFSWQRSA